MSDVTVGDIRVDVVVDDLRRTQIVQYAGASGDFNPLHTDEKFAVETAGRPTVLGHGMLTMGLVGRIVTSWFGPAAVRTFGVRFVAPVWPGDTLTTTARVNAVSEVDGRPTAELELTARNAEDVVVLTGTSSVWTGQQPCSSRHATASRNQALEKERSDA